MRSLFSKDLLTDNVVDSELFFRPLQSDDYERGFCELLGQLTVSDFSKSKFDERFKEMEKVGDAYYVIVCEDKKTNKLAAAGTILVEKKFLRGGGLCGHIEDIVVDSTYRGKNLGLRLIEQLKQVGTKVGCYKIILDCSEKNVPFYEKCAFAKKEVQMALYTKPSKL